MMPTLCKRPRDRRRSRGGDDDAGPERTDRRPARRERRPTQMPGLPRPPDGDRPPTADE